MKNYKIKLSELNALIKESIKTVLKEEFDLSETQVDEANKLMNPKSVASPAPATQSMGQVKKVTVSPVKQALMSLLAQAKTNGSVGIDEIMAAARTANIQLPAPVQP